MPAVTPLVQLKVTPGVPVVGVYENAVLLQMAAGARVLVKTGLGLTVTLITDVFEQPFAVSV